MKKRAQEEILGFVFVILILVIIGIFFLMITLRQPAQTIEKENYRINNLLSSMFYLTTSCENKNIQELILDCDNGKTNLEPAECKEDKPCTYVNKTISNILDKALKGGYSFEAKSSNDKPLILIKKGDCTRKQILSAISILPNGVSVKLLNCPA
ncbi:MAG: hypothetical protein KJ767_01065 [Nanoarchaeota archaeon]|nr:hypothetical protein [Nanoarchaeota archaeon]